MAGEPPVPNEPPAATKEGPSESEYYSEALAAFKNGDYQNAVRLAGHATLEQPRNQKTHLLLMLGLFAAGQYRPAAMEAHAVAALGELPDWPTVYAIYGNVETYTRQVRALEKFRAQNPLPPWKADFWWASCMRSTATKRRPRPSCSRL